MASISKKIDENITQIETMFGNWSDIVERRFDLDRCAWGATFYETTTNSEAQYGAPLISVNSDMIKLYNKTARQKIIWLSRSSTRASTGCRQSSYMSLSSLLQI